MRRWQLGFVPVLLLTGLYAVASLRKARSRLPDDGWPTNFAHRGASAWSPENTMAAFWLAAASGAGGLETDVHMTRDGWIVAIHDDTVDRTTDGSGLVREISLGELKGLDAGANFTLDGGATYPYRGEKVLTFDEVLRGFPDLAVNVDIKEEQPGIEAALLRMIRDAGAEERVLVVSESRSVIGRFRRLAKGSVKTGASRRETGVFYRLHRLGLEGLLRPAYARLQVPSHHGETEIVTGAFVRAAHGIGVRVDVWTIDEAGEMRRLLDLGADVIMTNKPEVMGELLAET